MEMILEAKNLCKSFFTEQSKRHDVLQSIYLKVSKGDFVSIMGPSGSGKSTLLYNLSGMDSITSGSVTLYGKALATMPEKALSHLRLSKVGFVFQDINLLNNLSIFDNIVLPGYLTDHSPRNEIDKRAVDLMNKMGVDELAHQNITQASGGQLQRVAICRALINQPDLIFADEPTGALNSNASQEVMDILVAINQQIETTILLATHDIKTALRADRVIYIVDGTIVAELNLGKYRKDRDNELAREAKLSEWLMTWGF